MAGSGHKSEAELVEALDRAAIHVPVGTNYVHYKQPDWAHRYQVVGHVILEANDEVAVLYRAMYMEREVVFARALSIWQETVEWEGQTVPRFAKVERP